MLNKLTHWNTLCILLDCIYTTRWYTVPTIPSLHLPLLKTQRDKIYPHHRFFHKSVRHMTNFWPVTEAVWCYINQQLHTCYSPSWNSVSSYKFCNFVKEGNELILVINMSSCTLEMWHWLSSIWNTTSVLVVRCITPLLNTFAIIARIPHERSPSRRAEKVYMCREGSVFSETTLQWTTVTNSYRLWMSLVMHYSAYN